MRDVVFFGLFVCMIPAAVSFGTSGVMLWIWVALMTPINFMYGFSKTLPYNKVAAIATILGIVVSKTNKKPYIDTHVLLLLLFLLQCTISYVFALVDSPRGDDLYDRVSKEIVLALVMLPTVRDRLRIWAVLLAVCLGMGLHGTSEAIKYLLSTGDRLVEPPGFFGDNNHFGLALLMALPALGYVGTYALMRIVRYVALAGLGLTLIAVIGTNSRGALAGLVVIGLIVLLQSKRKAAALGLVGVVVAGLLYFTPAVWRQRMDTIGNAEHDNSFLNRVNSWKMNTLVALDRPLVGGGFSAMEDSRVYDAYRPHFSSLDFISTGEPVGPIAAHSIYFQTLGDTGFIGLALFVGIILTAFNNLRTIKRVAHGRADLIWAVDLANALRLTMVAYCVSGAALSMAYFELFYVFTTLISVLRKHVEAEIKVPVALQVQVRLARNRSLPQGIPARLANGD